MPTRAGDRSEVPGSEPGGRVSIIIPCFNEARSVRMVVDRILEVPELIGCEIVVVDDGSTDQTSEILGGSLDGRRGMIARHGNNRGKGAAVRTGIACSGGEILVIQDADLEYDPGDIPLLLAPILAGEAEIVYGSRFLGRRLGGTWRQWLHRAGNGMLTILSNARTGQGLTDMETGHKAFRRSVLDGLELREERFGFEPEFTGKVSAAGRRIIEVPVSYRGRSFREGKKIKWRDGLRAVWCIFRYKGRSR